MSTLVATLSTKTEEDITISWVSEYALSRLCYSLNNGQSYILTEQTGTDGYLTFYNLEPNTTYKIILQGTERETGETLYSEVLEITTYDFPHCTGMPDFTIGEKLTLTFYNPLMREITVNLLGADGSTISNDTITGTTLTGFIDVNVIDRLYRSIPNASFAQYNVKTTYGSKFSGTESGGFYSVNKEECAPLLGAVSYEDRDPFTVTITGNNQIIVRNRSLPFFTATGISAQKYATVRSVKVYLNEEEYELTLNSGTASGLGSAVNSSTPLYAFFEVEDSRGLITQKEKFVNIYNWFEPETLIDLKRTNDGSGGVLKVDVNYAPVEGLNVLTLEYYTKKKADSEYVYAGVLENGVATTFLADAAYDWDIKVTVKDKFSGIENYVKTLSRYTPLIFFDADKYSVGVNCFPANNGTLEVKGEDVYEALFYKAGDVLTFENKKISCPVLFKSNYIYVSLNVPKSMKNVTPTLSVLKGNILIGLSNYMFAGSYTEGGFDILNDSRVVSYSCSKETDTCLLLQFQRTSTSDTLIYDFELNALTISFS